MSILEEILSSHCYFIIGEKGTGKTAYATFLNNTEYKNTISTLKFLSATDYETFYALKKKKHLEISSYVDIWKAIILLLLSQSVIDNKRAVATFRRSKINEIMKAVDEYYNNAFSPEVTTALKITDKSEDIAKLMCKYVEIGEAGLSISEFSESKFQMNIFYINKLFADSLLNLKLDKNITIFIDGIDVRPNNIPYGEYIECIRGLANACWSLNTEILKNHRDSHGQFKVMLLLRPDIYYSLNLQNSTNKILDNSSFLDWRTTYKEYRHSRLFDIGEKILLYNNENVKIDGTYWNQYFNWQIPAYMPKYGYDDAFVEFLRISLSRPRDILVIMKTLQKKMCKDGLGRALEFNLDTYKSDEFQNNYSTYFLGSLKDQLSFTTIP